MTLDVTTRDILISFSYTHSHQLQHEQSKALSKTSTSMAAPLPLHHQTRTPALSSDNSPLINLDNINNNNINSQYQAHFCLVSLEKCSTMRELKQIHAQMLRISLFFDPCAASELIAFLLFRTIMCV